ncbi:VOC family protein [Hyphococcus sp. DH-69]|uniref:VOC family protein n=1 Tax=Hyphococcus formosus TaxID=3143534 RepID=UPI00398B1890
MQVNVYLNFDGNCKEAMTFYHETLGGDLEVMLPFAGSEAEPHVPDDMKDNILHASLVVGETKIMASDASPDHYQRARGTSICLNLDDPEEAKRLYFTLSQDGEIIMPLEPTFFAKAFASFHDRFGVLWMIHSS